MPLLAAATLIGIATLAAVASPQAHPSFEEAGAVSVGRNVLAGLGPRTAFGSLAVTTSPLFAILLAAPSRIAGLDPYSWGHAISVASLVLLLVATLLLARDSGRWGAVLACAIVVAWLVPLELARSARPDELAAAVSIAYLPLGLSAFRGNATDRIRRGAIALLAGVVLGVAVLLDPRAIALAPIPAIAGLALRAPIRIVIRSVSLTAIGAVATTFPWLAWDAALSHRVYAIGVATSDLPGGLTGVGALVVGGALVGVAVSLVPSAPVSGRRDPRVFLDRGLPLAGYVAGALLGAWTLAVLASSVRPVVLGGEPLVSFAALRRYVGEWLPALLPVGIFGLGAIAALDPIMDGEPMGLPAAVALLASLPTIAIVVATAAPPRELVVPAVLLTVLAASGWVRLARRWPRLSERGRAGVAVIVGILVALETLAVVRQHAPHGGAALVAGLLALGCLGGIAFGVAAGLARKRMAGRLLVPTAALLAVVIAVGAAGASAVAAHRKPDRVDLARSAASTQVAAWLRTNVPAGSTVAVGPLEAPELAVLLGGRYRLRLFEPTIAGLLAPSPQAVAPADATAVNADWLALGVDPRRDALDGYSASGVEAILSAAPAAIVYLSGLPGTTPALLGALHATSGLSDVYRRTWTVPGGPLMLDIFRMGATPVVVPTDRIYLDAPTLDLVVTTLEGTEAGRRAAERLVPRLAFWPPAPGDAVALSRLRRVAAATP